MDLGVEWRESNTLHIYFCFVYHNFIKIYQELRKKQHTEPLIVLLHMKLCNLYIVATDMNTSMASYLPNAASEQC